MRITITYLINYLFIIMFFLIYPFLCSNIYSKANNDIKGKIKNKMNNKHDKKDNYLGKEKPTNTKYYEIINEIKDNFYPKVSKVNKKNIKRIVKEKIIPLGKNGLFDITKELEKGDGIIKNSQFLSFITEYYAENNINDLIDISILTNIEARSTMIYLYKILKYGKDKNKIDNYLLRKLNDKRIIKSDYSGMEGEPEYPHRVKDVAFKMYLYKNNKKMLDYVCRKLKLGLIPYNKRDKIIKDYFNNKLKIK